MLVSEALSERRGREGEREERDHATTFAKNIGFGFFVNYFNYFTFSSFFDVICPDKMVKCFLPILSYPV